MRPHNALLLLFTAVLTHEMTTVHGSSHDLNTFSVGNCLDPAVASETSYPYQTRSGCFETEAYSREFKAIPNTEFVALHFDQFHLPKNDYVTITSEDDPSIRYIYNSSTSGTFDVPLILATSVHLRLYTSEIDSTDTTPRPNSTCVGFHGRQLVFDVPRSNETICGGTDETKEAVCYSSFPAMLQRSRAVARLMIRKSTGLVGCTGWLLGSQGHLITNNHCIRNQAEAAGTQFEFMAQAATCSQSCRSQLACPGLKWKGTPAFVMTNANLDYTLIKLDASVFTLVGGRGNYLKLRRKYGPVLSEPVYIVEHPQAWGKRITNKNNNGQARIDGFTSIQAKYYLDTQPMASGSPVLSQFDNTVVALHHGGLAACPNLGIKSHLIVADLVARGLLPLDAATAA